MLKGGHAIMRLEKCEKRGYIEQTCESKNKTNKNFGILGNGFTHARTGLRTHEFSLCAQARSCVRRSLPRKPKNIETEQNFKTTN